MKIVDISEFYSPTGGGVRAYVEQKFKAAAKAGYALSVFFALFFGKFQRREHPQGQRDRFGAGPKAELLVSAVKQRFQGDIVAEDQGPDA